MYLPNADKKICHGYLISNSETIDIQFQKYVYSVQ